ncbi:hypothetical protein [Blastochloris viridis]|uniref:CheA signal transduction histidine kinase n=1 Tax=Blastochloris viridis TaxID=1079 RepID=A0A0H5BAI3_BLAVI|nr:hypothetical protein [Blastochloris viridis]ALK10835.1 hypothetical protein BVIR_3075 [Blastochloris viridis]BAR99190.1 hypothetical protein BV133_1597 [Blastochloris viridis]CUU43497.1 hypothetical protein BVIRIDIS_25190 [Blastochloris viridis]
MADFAPLISRAIAGLETNTPENRRVLYDRARAALVAQLRSIAPPLSETDITRERLGLEEAIRRIESDIVRSQREAALRPPPASGEAQSRESHFRPPQAPAAPADLPQRDVAPEPAAAAPPPAERKSAFQARVDRLAPGEGRQRLQAGLRDEKTLLEARQEPRNEAKPAGEAGNPTPEPVGNGDGASADVGSSAKASGGSAARSSQTGEQPPSQRPGRPPPSQQAGAAPAEPDAPPTLRRSKIEPRPSARSLGGRPRYDEIEMADEAAGGRARFWAIVVGLVVLVLVAAAIGLLAASGRLPLFGNGAPPRPAAQTSQPAERPKISDRITQDEPRSQAPQSQAQPAPQSSQQPPAEGLQVAQRAILYEEDPAAGQQGQVLIGTVAWRTETVTPGAGLPPDLAIRAEVQVPDRRMSASVTLRRNVDTALPASHTIELLFTTPADFPFGGVAKVPGILAKRGEGQRGAPLAGLAVDVTAGFFIVGLSAIEADVQRNLQLLKERAWLDIPLVYKNGRRAILSIEKGIPGDRVFADVFAAWGQ